MKKYQIIYADPPWEFENGWCWQRKESRAGSQYPTMSVKEISSLPIQPHVADNAHLYLWSPSRHLLMGIAKSVCEAWGFRPMNIITWCKPQLSLGKYFRNNTEHLIFGVKGSLETHDKTQGTYFIHKRLKHSEKPNVIRDHILKWSGDLPRLELFARKPDDLFELSYSKWDIWGNEGKNDITLIKEGT